MAIRVSKIKVRFPNQKEQEKFLKVYKEKHLTNSNLVIYHKVYEMLDRLIPLVIESEKDFERPEVKEVIFEYRDWVNGKKLTNSTRYNYYSTFRAGFSQVFGVSKYSKPPLTFFKMGMKYVRERNEADTRKVLANAESRKEVPDWRDMIEKAIQLLDSDSYLDITCGLLLLTGRRPVEILQTAQFKKVDKSHVIFSGQLKTDEPVPYEIPVLFDSSKIIKALKRIREMKDFTGRTTKQVRQSTGKNIKYRVEEYYGLKYTPKDLRALYFTICYKLFADRSEVDTIYCAKILGHKKAGIDGSMLNPVVSMSYNRFILPD